MAFLDFTLMANAPIELNLFHHHPHHLSIIMTLYLMETATSEGFQVRK